jgi:hypothetical protein
MHRDRAEPDGGKGSHPVPRDASACALHFGQRHALPMRPEEAWRLVTMMNRRQFCYAAAGAALFARVPQVFAAIPGHVPPAGGRQPPRCGTFRRLLLAQSRAWVKRQRPHASLCGGAGKPPAASRHPAAGLRRTMRCLGGCHFAFDTGPRFDLCYASLPLDTCRACPQTLRTMFPWQRCGWCHARRQ